MGYGTGQTAPRSGPRRAVRAAAALAVVGLVAAGSSLLAPAASAAGILPTTTTVTASPASSTQGDAVVLTATVNVLGLPGLGITPTGLVSFAALNGSSSTPLGSKALGACLLKTCTASITTTALPVGTTSVNATYAGDLLAAASSGSAGVSVAPLTPPDPEPDVEDEVTCGNTSTCSTETITSPDGSTELTVSSNEGNQTVTASLTEGVALDVPRPERHRHRRRAGIVQQHLEHCREDHHVQAL